MARVPILMPVEHAMSAVEVSAPLNTAEGTQQSRWRSLCKLEHVITAAYLALLGLLLIKHGLWRDEAQPFVIARDSDSIAQLLGNLRYEGHPPLWYMLLYVLTRFTTWPGSMQILHWLLGGASVYFVTRFAPFPAVAKVLFPFGYFMLFEYGVVARSYQLLVLLCVLFLVLWQRRSYAFILGGLLLALLSLTHALGEIIACALGVTMLADVLATAAGRKAIAAHPWRLLWGLFLAGGGAALSVKLVIPPADSNFAVGWHTDTTPAHVQQTLVWLWHAYVPIPKLQVRFWETNFLADAHTAATWGTIMALAGLALVIRSWRAVLFLLIANGGLLVFMHMKLEGSIRHHGLLFIALILGSWIAWMPHPKWPAGLWPKMLWLPPRLALVALLAVQACAGGITVWYCWQYPFSPAYDAALALRKQARPDEVLIINQEYLTAPLAAFLPGRTFFLVDGGRWDTIVRWRPHSRATTIQEWARDFTTTRHQSVILVASYRLSNLPPGTQLLAGFPGGIEGNESFYLYRVPP